jgi:hypothetical protein
MNTDVATRYRREILEPGGSRDAADLVESFLGRPYGFEAYREWLSGSWTPGGARGCGGTILVSTHPRSHPRPAILVALEAESLCPTRPTATTTPSRRLSTS